MKIIAILLAAVLAGAAVAVCLLAPGYYAYLLGTLATTALVGVGLNVLLGLSGEVSLGQGGFLALGAYAVGILTTKAGVGFWEALPLAVLLALIACLLVASSIGQLAKHLPFHEQSAITKAEYSDRIAARQAAVARRMLG